MLFFQQFNNQTLSNSREVFYMHYLFYRYLLSNIYFLNTYKFMTNYITDVVIIIFKYVTMIRSIYQIERNLFFMRNTKMDANFLKYRCTINRIIWFRFARVFINVFTLKSFLRVIYLFRIYYFATLLRLSVTNTFYREYCFK